MTSKVVNIAPCSHRKRIKEGRNDDEQKGKRRQKGRSIKRLQQEKRATVTRQCEGFIEPSAIFKSQWEVLKEADRKGQKK